MLLVLAAAAASADEPDQVLITYDLKIGAKELSGVSHELEWAFVAIDEGHGWMRLRVPVESFDSGHADFDRAVRKALDSEHHPLVEIEGEAREGRLDGKLALAGTVRPIAAKLHMERVGGHLVAVASMAFDLRDYGIAIPDVDPHMSIDAVVRLTTSPRAVLAGGHVGH
jgi:polyisoprenoid-binding protein YceI